MAIGGRLLIRLVATGIVLKFELSLAHSFWILILLAMARKSVNLFLTEKIALHLIHY